MTADCRKNRWRLTDESRSQEYLSDKFRLLFLTAHSLLPHWYCAPLQTRNRSVNPSPVARARHGHLICRAVREIFQRLQWQSRCWWELNWNGMRVHGVNLCAVGRVSIGCWLNREWW